MGNQTFKLKWLKVALLATFAFFVTSYLGQGCSSGGGGDEPAPANTQAEPPYCDQAQPIQTQATITGQARFLVRPIILAGPGACGGLCAEESGSGRPIQFAEVNILNPSGRVITCGMTDAAGNFNIAVPGGAPLTVRVNSRSLNSHLSASVLDTPNTNQPYFISKDVVTPASGSVSAGVLTATTGGSILGGAFNIHYNFLRANQFLRLQLCGGIETSCTAFSAASKVTAYWKAGVNPYSYFGGPSNSGLSFFVPGTAKLYILGGVDGDTTTQDTDHFDDAVITHEYGHFIEDSFAKTDSPGGSHDGGNILDARLTWGEGWANFFSSVVRGNTKYQDTAGNSDGTTFMFFNYDIERNAPSRDTANKLGEGNFREFAITRSLWDSVDPITYPVGFDNLGAPKTVGQNGGVAGDDLTTETAATTFANFWSIFTGPLRSPASHFRSAGLFLMDYNNPTYLSSPPDLSTAVSGQKLIADIADFGRPLPITGAACTLTLDANDPTTCNLGGQVLSCSTAAYPPNACCSNQLDSNDFFEVDFDGSNVSTISVTRVSGTGDLDLYLFRENYVFEDQSTIARSSAVHTGNPTTETINLSGLAPGHYMMNVRVFTKNGNPGPTGYQITVNGSGVCP